ncbi:MAG: hypothetical protein AB7V27_17140 [Candidatus Binatia bacterium]
MSGTTSAAIDELLGAIAEAVVGIPALFVAAEAAEDAHVTPAIESPMSPP